ncbi:Molybdopterin-synthase sulfurtransferase [Patellaria atrata CBS 101060]|uniref:Adenylyltransferase and sulfurtransferase uba4 n=1 Tax=Patellaria atrata CBS 101060 TaxID=1346257 RepID=A0A9P4VN85_9PEZI|nr:Molybdopterin-synthase sulfurtransferase [Patellaria atrata CBS 101060]
MAEDPTNIDTEQKWPLDPEEYKRYGRQLIMPEIGLQGQLNLKSSSVLIVGVGGLGCPAAAYLAGAGVGKIGLVDGDTVEKSNLHRQILHSTATVGMSKVESAIKYLTSLNPTVKYVPHIAHVSTETTLDLFTPYDLVLDCTDTPASRYLISDTCVLLGKPLISASALRIDGQLMILNYPPLPPGNSKGGPCYRCFFPKPPSPESVTSCGEGGILGPVVGVMGVLQALEAIKLICAGINSEEPVESRDRPILHIFSGRPGATSPFQFRAIPFRGRKSNCAVCSSFATITKESLTSGSLDYQKFCGILNPVTALRAEERVSVEDFAESISKPMTEVRSAKRTDSRKYTVVDVREKVQFELGNLPGSINIPYSELCHVTRSDNVSMSAQKESSKDGQPTPAWVTTLSKTSPDASIYVICRLGNDSQLAVQKMKEYGLGKGSERFIADIKGGFSSWREMVDPTFPDY